MIKTGLVHIYCGDGKGKTTAAMGLALRAVGHGLPVLIVQFLKDGTSGECRILSKLPNVTLLSVNPCGKFSFQMNEQERTQTRDSCQELFREVICNAKSSGLLILDEIFGAISAGFLSEDEVLAFLKGKPNALEIVLTGRAPGNVFFSTADYISEIVKRRHPYDKGIAARDGIEK